MAVCSWDEVLSLLLLSSVISWAQVSGEDPKIVSPSQSFTANVGTPITFRCEVQNQGNHKVQWTYLNHNKPISQNSKILPPVGNRYEILHPEGGSGVWNLNIMGVAPEDDGLYQCNVEGFPLVQIVSTLVVSNVSKPVRPTAFPNVDFTDCCVRQNVSSSCLPACFPSELDLNQFDAVANCKFDLPRLLHCGSDGRNHIPCCRRRFVPDHCLDYCINDPPPVSSLDDQYGTCLDKANEIVACFEEGQFLLPGPPNLVSAHATSQYEIYMSWSRPAENGDTVTGYQVYYQEDSETVFRHGPVVSETHYKLDSLTPNTLYLVYVQSINAHGSSLPSMMFRLKTLSDNPFIGSENSTMLECCRRREVSTNCQKLLCSGKADSTAATADLMGCFTEMDKVFACIAAERNHTSCCMQRDVPAICHPLCSGQFGAARVDSQPMRVMNCLTYHMPSINSCFQEGMGTIPGPPNKIQVAAVTSTTAEVEWEPSKPSNLASSYRVRYAVSSSSSFTEVTVRGTRAVLVDLEPGQRYQVEVIAIGDEGTSLATPSVLFLTYGGESGADGPSVTAAPALDVLQCCKSQNISDQCHKFCDYDVENMEDFNPSELMQCGRFIGQTLACGADGRNHTECCQLRNVPDKCIHLCGMTQEIGINYNLNFDHIICIQHLAEITDCMEEGLEVLPTAPARVTVTDVRSTSISLNWSPPSRTGYGITNFIVQYRDSLKLTSWQHTIKVGPEQQNYIIQNLIASTLYEIRMLTSTSKGNSLPSPILVQMTSPKEPPPPINGRFNFTSPGQIIKCCGERNVSDACMPACSGTQVVSIKDCGPDLGKLLYCAADEGDHSVCCARRNVPRSCRPLCSGKPLSGELSSAVCVAFLDEILTCFQDGYRLLPSRPQNFQLHRQGARELEFGWDSPEKNPTEVKYRLYVKKGMYSPKEEYSFREFVTSPYTLKNLEPFTEYSVYLIAMNDQGVSMPTNTLVVWTTREDLPEVNVYQDPSGYLTVNSSVKFSCELMGSSEGSVQWRRGTKNFDHNQETITIEHVQKSDTGRWTCMANNGKTATAYDVILKVKYPPTVDVPNKQVFAAINTWPQPVLECNFKGFPDEVHWFKNGKEIPAQLNSAHIFRETSKINEDDGTLEAALVIELLKVDHYGMYQCHGKNHLGSAEGQIELVNPHTQPGVTVPPFIPPPQPVNVTECCLTKGVEQTCMDACSFDIDISILDNAHQMLHCLPSLPKMIECAADGRNHSKCCDDRNIPTHCHPFCAGIVPMDDPKAATCLQHYRGIIDCMEDGHVNLPSSPREVNAHLTDLGYVEISWIKPLKNPYMVTSYMIYYSTSRSSQEQIEVKNKPYDPVSKAQLSGIHSNAIYTIYMKAKNHHGTSVASNTATVETYEMAPSAPQHLQANDFFASGIYLHWSAPDVHPGAVTYYIVYYRPVGEKKTNHVTSPMQSYTLSGLEANTKYEIWVTAKSSHFESRISNTVAVESPDAIIMGHAQGKRSSAGVVVGIMFAVIIILAVAGIAAFYYFRMRKPPVPELKETVSFENPGYATTGEARVHVGVSGMADSNYQPSNGHMTNSSIMKETTTNDYSADQNYSKQNGVVAPNSKEENPYATLDVTHLNPPPEVDGGNINLSFEKGDSKM